MGYSTQRAWSPAPTQGLLSSGVGVLTAFGNDKAAALLGVVARLVCHVDTENVISHEVEQIHVAHVLCVRGVVGGPVEGAGRDFVLVWIQALPAGPEQLVRVGAWWGSVHSVRAEAVLAGRHLR